jgi:hypothetical protein
MSSEPQTTEPVIVVGHKPARLAAAALREWLVYKRAWWNEGDRSENWPEGEDPNDMWCVDLFLNELDEANGKP